MSLISKRKGKGDGLFETSGKRGGQQLLRERSLLSARAMMQGGSDAHESKKRSIEKKGY